MVPALGSVLLAAFTLGPLPGHGGQLGGEAAGTVLHTLWVWAGWSVSALMIFIFAALLLFQESPPGSRSWRPMLPGPP